MSDAKVLVLGLMFEVPKGPTLSIDDEDAVSVLEFWFGDVPPEKRFAFDPLLDAMISGRFAALRDAVLSTDAAGWRDTPNRLLAAVILLDQFSRNIYRGSRDAFAADPLARSLTLQALSAGWDRQYNREQLLFLYLPLTHAESSKMQALSVAKYDVLGDANALTAALEHAEVIRDFGRFPSRNEALARASTAQELVYLEETDHTW